MEPTRAIRIDHMPLRNIGFLLALPIVPMSAQITPPRILSRVAEEAEVFRQNLPNALAQEILVQRAVLPPPRFRPRMGAAALAPIPERIQVHEIVSEYTVGPLQQSPGSNLVEWRQIVSVDGRTIQSPEAARRTLTLNLKSPDEGLRKRMLEGFARYGLVDVATDYGLILLAFDKRGLARMSAAEAGSGWIGAEEATAIRWRQTSPEGGELAFRGRQVARTPLEGILWVRRSDGLPLRIDAWAEYSDANRTIRDEASVDYILSPHGFLTPASVLHHHLVDGRLMTENYFRYEPFKLFSANTELKFTELPEISAPGKKK
jgi:hypothetical protein